MYHVLAARASHHLSTIYDHATTRHKRRGASLVEYVLLISLMALACFVATKYLGSSTARPYSGAASGLDG